MFKSSILNAVLASVYIIAIVFVLNYVSQTIAGRGLFAPMVMLSLLTLSVAMMGAFFFLQPIQLYLDKKKKEAIAFFLQTLTAFAILTLAGLLVLLSGILGS